MAGQTQTIEAIVKGINGNMYVIDILNGKYLSKGMQLKKDKNTECLNVGDTFKANVKNKWKDPKTTNGKWVVEFYYTDKVEIINKGLKIKLFFAEEIANFDKIDRITFRNPGQQCRMNYFDSQNNRYYQGMIKLNQELSNIPFGLVVEVPVNQTGKYSFEPTGPTEKKEIRATIPLIRKPDIYNGNTQKVGRYDSLHCTFEPCWKDVPGGLHLTYKGLEWIKTEIAMSHAGKYFQKYIPWYPFDKEMYELNKPDIESELERIKKEEQRKSEAELKRKQELEQKNYQRLVLNMAQFGLWDKENADKITDKTLLITPTNTFDTNNKRYSETYLGKQIRVYNDTFLGVNYKSKSSELLDIYGNPAHAGSYIFLYDYTSRTHTCVVAQIDSLAYPVVMDWGSPTKLPDDLDIYPIQKMNCICHTVSEEERKKLCSNMSSYPSWLADGLMNNLNGTCQKLGYDKWEVIKNGSKDN